MTARGRIDRRRHLALDAQHHHLELRVGDRRGVAQHPGIGVQRLLEDRRDRTGLDDAAEIHDRHALAEIAHDAEVVRDEDEGEPAALLQPLQQQQYLRLDRNVEGGDGLVGNQQFRLQRERAGDADPLALAAAELVRVAQHRAVGQPDLGQERARALLAFRLAGNAVHAHRLDQRLADPPARIERGVGILEDDLQLAAQHPQTRLARRDHVLALEDDLTRVGLDQAQRGAPGRRLAAAGFADQAEGLAVAHAERDAVERADGDACAPAESRASPCRTCAAR